MKLLFITQKVDVQDDVLGFAHEWIRALSHEFESIQVICLARGTVNLNEKNIQVHSLGKERKASRVRYVLLLFRYIRTYRHEYNVVFVHMNPEYIVLAGWLWKWYRKPIALWYAHGKVNMKLRIASWFSDLILTSTPKGYRLQHRNVGVIGQGIDTQLFSPQSSHAEAMSNVPFRLLYVGRIAPVKNIDVIIDAVRALRAQGRACTLNIIGSVATTDQSYAEELEQRVHRYGLTDVIQFLGAIPHPELPTFLRASDCFLNAGATGSLDKTMVEAMATQLPVVTSNESLLEIAGEFVRPFMFRERDVQDCVEAITRVLDMPANERARAGSTLRSIAVRDHGLEQFAHKVRLQIEQIVRK